MKELLNKIAKAWLLSLAVGIFIGGWLGSNVERNRVYADCRYTGVTRMGEVAFKCEQFSRVILLTPEEIAKKAEKK